MQGTFLPMDVEGASPSLQPLLTQQVQLQQQFMLQQPPPPVPFCSSSSSSALPFQAPVSPLSPLPVSPLVQADVSRLRNSDGDEGSLELEGQPRVKRIRVQGPTLLVCGWCGSQANLRPLPQIDPSSAICRACHMFYSRAGNIEELLSGWASWRKKLRLDR